MNRKLYSALLHVATEYDCEAKIIRALIEKGADVGIQDLNGNTPVHKSLRYNPEIVLYLISQCSDLNVKNNDGKTPLHLAVEENYPTDIIQALVEKGASVDIQDCDEDTPLHNSLIYISDPEMILYLVSQSSNLNIQNENGYTPLHIAIKNHSPTEVIYTLVDRGADLTIQNKTGKSPFDLATEQDTLPRFLRAFSEEFDRLKKWHLSSDVSVYDVIIRRLPFGDYADRILDFLCEGHTFLWSFLFQSVVSSRGFTLRLECGDLRLVDLPSEKVMDFLSDVDVGNLLLAHRPWLVRSRRQPN